MITPLYGKSSIIYYLHEYPFGRTITSLLSSQHSNLRSIGMQHGPSSETKLVYRLSKKDISRQSNPIFLPDAVLAEDFESKSYYRQNGYRRVIEMREAPRLRLTNTEKKTSADKEDTYHLIATGLHDSSTVVALMIDRILENTSQKFVLKFHPKANLKGIDTKGLPSNCFVVDDPINELLESASKVFSSYSSVGLEAKSKGIEVEFLSIPGRVSQL